MNKTACKLTILLIICCVICGCTTYRYSNRQEFVYLASQQRQINNQRTFDATFDKVWEAIVAYFAKNNISIETIEKASGIIAAQKIFSTAQEAIQYVDPGLVKVRDIEIKEKMQPREYFGSANPDYIRRYGKVVGVEERIIREHDIPANYGLILKFNVFCKKEDGNKINVQINTELVPTSLIYDYQPVPRTTGFLEIQFLNYIDDYLKK